jgi:NAD(P)-dependent dehydrogenase (short-subunit alcohol dehydrogenase family)
MLKLVRAFEYAGAGPSALNGPIEITDAAPEYAEALSRTIQAHGVEAHIVPRPSGESLAILTEGLSVRDPGQRHYAVLEALQTRVEGAPTVVLDMARGELQHLGGCAGLCRSFRIERPQARVFSLSLETCPDMGQLSERVIRSLAEPEGDYILRENGGWREIPDAELIPPTGSVVFDQTPVWLVTGGARGVTADCAIELAHRTGGTFILLGRSSLAAWPDWLEPQSDIKVLRGLLARNSSRADMPKKPVEIDRLARRLLASAEIASTLSAIEDAGAKALYLQADIGHAAEVQKAIAAVQQSEGAITGLVHGAGVLSDGRVEALQLQDFETVFAPKVEGLETVLSCLDVSLLRHVAMFSSASAVFGNEGQANYAAANGWLNNAAEQLSLSLPEAQVKAFCWGPWQGGMVDDALARMFTERGIGLISRSEGARIFADQLLLSSHERVRFVIGDEWGA